jgi:FKBP-type peptidyl-prolyl cis-trans isomerase
MQRWMAAGLVALVMASTASAQTAEEKAFLAKTNAEPGVVALPGVSYKVLKSGPTDGVHPNRGDSITVRYVGRFKDGKVFNTSPDDGKTPTTFDLSKLIPGWVATLRLMRPGDQWRLTIPAYLAYGSAGKSPYIPPESTLVFDVELLAVIPGPPPAPPPATKPAGQ